MNRIDELREKLRKADKELMESHIRRTKNRETQKYGKEFKSIILITGIDGIQ